MVKLPSALVNQLAPLVNEVVALVNVPGTVVSELVALVNRADAGWSNALAILVKSLTAYRGSACGHTRPGYWT